MSRRGGGGGRPARYVAGVRTTRRRGRSRCAQPDWLTAQCLRRVGLRTDYRHARPSRHRGTARPYPKDGLAVSPPADGRAHRSARRESDPRATRVRPRSSRRSTSRSERLTTASAPGITTERARRRRIPRSKPCTPYGNIRERITSRRRGEYSSARKTSESAALVAFGTRMVRRATPTWFALLQHTIDARVRPRRAPVTCCRSASITPSDEAYWLAQFSGWDHERFDVDRDQDRSVSAVVIGGGSCEVDVEKRTGTTRADVSRRRVWMLGRHARAAERGVCGSRVPRAAEPAAAVGHRHVLDSRLRPGRPAKSAARCSRACSRSATACSGPTRTPASRRRRRSSTSATVRRRSALLRKGLAPADDHQADPGTRIRIRCPSDWTKQGRQFAVMNLKGEYAAYTGPKATEWAGNKGGKYCTAQGNILAGPGGRRQHGRERSRRRRATCRSGWSRRSKAGRPAAATSAASSRRRWSSSRRTAACGCTTTPCCGCRSTTTRSRSPS